MRSYVSYSKLNSCEEQKKCSLGSTESIGITVKLSPKPEPIVIIITFCLLLETGFVYVTSSPSFMDSKFNQIYSNI